MAKAIFAATNIKTAEKFVPAGTEIKRGDFSDDALVELLDAGAIEIRVLEEAPEAEVVDDTTPPADDPVDPAKVED